MEKKHQDSSSKLNPPSSFRQLLADFCGYTTAHGLGRLAQSSNTFTRLVWSLFCIGAFTIFVLQVYYLFVIYISRQVSTVVKVEHESRVRFPAVTVCNMNMLRFDKVPQSYIEEILNNLSAYATLSSGSEEMGDSPTNESQTIEYEESGYLNVSSEEEVIELQYRIQEAIRAKIALQNDSMLFSMGHQFEDFVFECYFQEYDCSNYTRYWYHFWDYRFGNCFTFNGGINDDGQSQKVLSSHSTGPTGGLKLNMFIEQSQYIPELTHTAGARVVIHDQGQMPFPDNEGLDVMPSCSTSFGIRRTVIERVDPFGNGSCISEDDVLDKNIYTQKFNASYSKQTCLHSCHAEKQILECGCVEAQFPADADICDIQNSTTGKCLDTLLQKLLHGELNCEKQCRTPCREVMFKTTLSMSQWPSYVYEGILEERVQEKKVFKSEKDFGYYLSENFLQVRIFFEQLNFERVIERVSYERVNLAADIGGQLGLWIGISALTCCELLELVLLLIRSALRRAVAPNIVHVKPATN